MHSIQCHVMFVFEAVANMRTMLLLLGMLIAFSMLPIALARNGDAEATTVPKIGMIYIYKRSYNAPYGLYLLIKSCYIFNKCHIGCFQER